MERSAHLTRRPSNYPTSTTPSQFSLAGHLTSSRVMNGCLSTAMPWVVFQAMIVTDRLARTLTKDPLRILEECRKDRFTYSSSNYHGVRFECLLKADFLMSSVWKPQYPGVEVNEDRSVKPTISARRSSTWSNTKLPLWPLLQENSY